MDEETNCNKTATVILKANNVEDFLRYKNNTVYLHTLPAFYTQLLDMWYAIHNTKPTLVKDILNENIWFNEQILIDNKPVNNKIWRNAGIRNIKDLVKGNRLMTKQQLEEKYNIRCDFLFYNGLQAAIPRSWLEKIHECNNVESIPVVQENLSVNINDKNVEIRKVTCKQLYWAEIERISQRPTSYYSWESNYYYASFDWELINMIPYECSTETHLQSFQYKIIHRYFPCKYNLHIWRIEDEDKCTQCNEVDTLSHYFAECKMLESFWKILKTWFLRNFQFIINFTPLDILLGIPNYTKNCEIDILNFVILFAKNFIYNCK